MKRIYSLFLVLPISFQIHSCTPAFRNIGIAFTGIAAATNVYRVHTRDYYCSSEKQDSLRWSAALGLTATLGVGFALHRLTPPVRLKKAIYLLDAVKANPLLQRFHLVNTSDFPSIVKKQYVSSASFPYAKAFRALKESKEKTLEAIELINEAQETAKDLTFGNESLKELEENNQKLNDLMLKIKEQQEFVPQYVGK